LNCIPWVQKVVKELISWNKEWSELHLRKCRKISQYKIQISCLINRQNQPSN
jgi:hypothetical protein